jgi:hypothetical protein
MFASPYVGRKRWAQPNDRFCYLTAHSKQGERKLYESDSIFSIW